MWLKDTVSTLMCDHKALNFARLTFRCKASVLDPYSVLLGHGVFNSTETSVVTVILTMVLVIMKAITQIDTKVKTWVILFDLTLGQYLLSTKSELNWIEL